MDEAFVPSKFMAHTHTEDGTLILYCAMTGAIGAVPADKAEIVKDALKRNMRHIAPLEGILNDLKLGGFLIPEDTNEMQSLNDKYLAWKYDEEYLNLIIMPTEECNFRCVYCYESFAHGKMPEKIRNSIKQYIASQGQLKRLLISWFGGEPLLVPDVVIEMSQFFHQYSMDHGIQYTANMTTNGSLLLPDVADQIIHYGVRSFQITLDGLPGDHNKLRVLASGEGTFESIVKNLHYLKSTDYPFVVILRHNFDPKNFERIEEFVQFLKTDFGNDPRFILMFRPIRRLGGDNDKNISIFKGKSAHDAVMTANQLGVEAGFRVGWSSVQLTPFSFVCYAAKPRSFVVGPDGNIYKCTVELERHERNIIGQLHPDGKMELDQQKMALWCESSGIFTKGKCRDCFFVPVCFGNTCPKRWLDKNACECPTEKTLIEKSLELIVKQSRLPMPPIMAQA